VTRVLVVVQARMSSTRLPGKVALDLAGAPMLARQLERIQAADTPFEVCVATSREPGDDRVVAIAEKAGVRWHRGALHDCLARHASAAREADADVVVKIPSDCPLVEPSVVDRVLGAFLAARGAYDYVSNLRPASWPDGNDVEVMSRAALEQADREATRPIDREHTTPFLWDQPGRFRLGNVAWEAGVDCSRSHRFTVDYPEDYVFVRAVFHELYRPSNPVFRLGSILQLLAEQPRLLDINQRFLGGSWESRHRADLRTAGLPSTAHLVA
jgi:spore coat polysaccharide biosynthesis protein SpsF